MKWLLPVILVILCAFVFGNRITLANWYAGNIHNTGYGAKANIYTPSSPVFLIQDGQSGESSWVSTVGSTGGQMKIIGFRPAGITTGMTINRQALSNLLHQENISYMISVRMNGETKKSIWCITNTIPSTNGVH